MANQQKPAKTDLISLNEIMTLAGISRSKMQTIARLQINGFPPVTCIDALNKYQYNRKAVLAWLKNNNPKTTSAQPKNQDDCNNRKQQLDNLMALTFLTRKLL